MTILRAQTVNATHHPSEQYWNVTLGLRQADFAVLDKWAKQKGKSRSELLRDLVTPLLRARAKRTGAMVTLDGL